MQKAIIHTDTRVIRRLTVDEVPEISPDESVVVLDQDINIDDGYWKLDLQNKKKKATNKEVDDSDVDIERVTAKKTLIKTNLKNLMNEIANNGATLENLQSYFQLLVKL